MSFDDQLRQQMRAAADSVQPLPDLVEGGISRGRRQRRRRIAATGGALVLAAATTAAAVALPDIWTAPDLVASDDGADMAAVTPGAGSSDGLTITESDVVVVAAELESVLHEVAALADGELGSGLPGLDEWEATLRLDLDDRGYVEAHASNSYAWGASDEPCAEETTRGECEVLLSTAWADIVGITGALSEVVEFRLRSTDDALAGSTGVRILSSLSDGTALADVRLGDAQAMAAAVLDAIPDLDDPDRGPMTREELKGMVVAIGELSSASSGEFVDRSPLTAGGLVRVNGQEAFEPRVHIDRSDDNKMETWSNSCELGARDGKPCEELLNTGAVGIFASKYPHQGDREALRYVADLSEGSLVISIDNYMETVDGKVVGMSWAEAGIVPHELAAGVEATGLLDR